MESKTVAIPDAGYQSLRDQWRTVRDVIAGSRAVHDGGEKYLPKLTDQTPEEYEAYQKRAGWYGATSRTRDGMRGLVFRKEPEIRLPEELEEIKSDVTMSGTSAAGLSERVFSEAITTGRVGILVDYQRVEEDDVSEIARRERNFRPYMTVYPAESIIGTRTGRFNNKTVVTQIRLMEIKSEEVDDFSEEEIPRVRVLELADGVYRQRIFERKPGSEDTFVLIDTVVPLMDGEPLDYIPFFFIGSEDTGPGYQKSPLYDLAELNLDFYRTKADYKHGLHFTGLPTAVITGHTSEDEDGEYRVGSTTAWIFSDPSADAKYLEFQGGGLSESREELRAIRDDMASMGARMLATEKRQAEAAESHIIKRSGENSMLATIANNTSEGVSRALKMLTTWAGSNADDVAAVLNTDFLPVEMSATDVVNLWKVTQSGGMSIDDYIYNLKQGERLDPTLDDDERRNAIETRPPAI